MACILFADDEPWTMEPYAKRLETKGHRVILADNVKDAQEALLSRNVDLMVLDIMLPRISMQEMLARFKDKDSTELRHELKIQTRAGVQLYRVAKERLHSMPVVIWSALSESDIRDYEKKLIFDCPFLRKGEDSSARLYRAIDNGLSSTAVMLT